MADTFYRTKTFTFLFRNTFCAENRGQSGFSPPRSLLLGFHLPRQPVFLRLNSQMRWIAPSEKDNVTGSLEKSLWDAADQFRANSGLKSQEYSAPVLGLIFLRFAEVRFTAQRAKLENTANSSRRGSRLDKPTVYHAKDILYLPAESRFEFLINRPEGANIAGLCKSATLKEIEAQGWSLNPGRYVGVVAGEEMSDEDFKEKFEALNEELETLNGQARELEATIAKSAAEILET